MATGSRFAQLRQLFEEVCDLAPDARRPYLQRSGASDDVVAEVEALVAAETRGLQRAAAPVAALLAHLPETELDVGDRIGAWKLVHKLASGGMGAVYRAERVDGHFEQQAAIKLLRGIPTDDALALLAAERQILAGLQHPHIARLLDGGATPGGQPYLVMEYVEGVAIDRWCAEGGLRLKARLRLFRNVCRAVAFAHQRLVVHCDLKPSNVLVRADGAPVLLDFGIARALDRTSARPWDSYYTPGYASPEQMAGAPVSVASDVYSLGLILFELVSGRKARLDANDRTVTLLSHAQRRASELAGEQCTWRRELRGDIDAIIQRATAQTPGLRYPSADALAGDIERHLDAKPVHARAPSLRYRLGRLVRRRWPLFAAGAAIVVMGIGFSWRLVNERDRALAAERDALLQAETAGQVSEFLISIFEFANPDKNPTRRDISAREMLEESTQRLDGRLSDKPGVKARLLYVLARAWERLGQPRRSIDLYRAGIGEWQRAGSSYDPSRAEGLGDLAVLESNNGMDREALQSANQALALRESASPRNELDLADAWNTMGVVLSANDNQLAESQRYMEQAIEVRRRHGDSNQYSSMSNLADIFRKQGNLDRAIALYEETLAGRRAQYGGDEHPSVLMTLRSYGEALAEKGRVDEGIALFRKSVELQKKIEGGDSTNIAKSYNELGSMLHDVGRYAEAIQNYRESLRLHTTAAELLPAQYVQPLNNLALALYETGNFAEAEPLLRESLQRRRAALAADDLLVLRAEHNLARLLMRSGRAAEARPLVEHALATRRQRLEADHADIGRSTLLTVELLRHEGRLNESAALLAQLDASPIKANRLDRVQREQERANQAFAHARPADAVGALRKAHELMREGNGDLHPLTAAAALELAAALAAVHEDDAARRLVADNRVLVENTFAEASTQRERLRELLRRYP